MQASPAKTSATVVVDSGAPGKGKRKRRWVVVPFALPFAGFAVFMLFFMLVPTLLDGYRMQSWEQGIAHLASADLDVNRGDDSTTYRARATYTYRFQGREYRGDRVAIGRSGDNIGDFQQTLGRKLIRAYESNQPVPVWIDPAEPARSVLNRDLRWGMVGVYLAVVLGAGGIGFGLIWFALRPRSVRPDSAKLSDKPWLLRPEWLGPEIESGARSGMRAAWFVAALFNVIAIPLAFLLMRAYFEGEIAAIAGLLLPLAGIVLVAWAVRGTLDWRRFGAAALVMDPYPGAIGGQCGGTIDVRLPYDANLKFPVSLSCLYSHMTGSGKNRRRAENVVWQREGFAHTEPCMDGTRLEILFDVDADLPASDLQDRSSYHLWRLLAEADLPGVDFDRSYEIPVFPTGESARQLSRSSITHRQAAAYRERVIEHVLDIEHVPGGVELYYPPFRHPALKLLALLLGLVFFGVGVLTGGTDMPVVMRAIFGVLGGAMALASAYNLMVSLRVRMDHVRLETRRSLLGVPVGGQVVPRDAIECLSLKRSSSSYVGEKHTVWFKLQARCSGGKAVTIGHNLAGRETAWQALQRFSGLTGIPVADALEENVLA